LAALAALLLASCATLPSARRAESPWAALPDDGDLYLFADVRQARGLLEPLAGSLSGGKPGRLAPLLDRSKEAYACLYLADAAAGAAELAVTGRWSPDLVSMRMSFSCGWVRHEPALPSPASPASTTPPAYWSVRRGALEIGSPARGLLLAAAGRPGALERMMVRRLSVQEGLVERARASDPRVGPFLAGAALYACLPAAGKVSGLPMHQLWLAARREADQYELGALASLAGTPNPRALAALVRLAAAALLRKASIPEVVARLRALEITAEAEGLTVRGLKLSETELLALLRGALLPQTAQAAEDAGDAGDADARSGD
jgi:hypothetical protein